jgi:hypothetical protein
MLSVFVATRESASVTCTVKVLVPVPVGVPEIALVLDANVNPRGKLPTVMDHVLGVVPPETASDIAFNGLISLLSPLAWNPSGPWFSV